MAYEETRWPRYTRENNVTVPGAGWVVVVMVVVVVVVVTRIMYCIFLRNNLVSHRAVRAMLISEWFSRYSYGRRKKR
ncbi:hypothetical protein E2C01_039462 [Portunus trituberculatus]|uniref:Uncharacterized protein n=1 Tax=Portunus trituberculatus TaxID=210409 RepID=A0A5B7FJX1_PORTR|nr:hypothetical protein [Portunus trituberculatus]